MSEMDSPSSQETEMHKQILDKLDVIDVKIDTLETKVDSMHIDENMENAETESGEMKDPSMTPSTVADDTGDAANPMDESQTDASPMNNTIDASEAAAVEADTMADADTMAEADTMAKADTMADADAMTKLDATPIDDANTTLDGEADTMLEDTPPASLSEEGKEQQGGTRRRRVKFFDMFNMKPKRTRRRKSIKKTRRRKTKARRSRKSRRGSRR